MALIKEQVTRFGNTASYWKVGLISIDWDRKEISFSLMLYYKKNAQDFVDCYTVNDLVVNPDKEVFDKYFGAKKGFEDIYSACYTYAKENVEYFKDAVRDTDDVLVNETDDIDDTPIIEEEHDSVEYEIDEEYGIIEKTEQIEEDIDADMAVDYEEDI